MDESTSNPTQVPLQYPEILFLLEDENEWSIWYIIFAPCSNMGLLIINQLGDAYINVRIGIAVEMPKYTH